MKDKQLAQPRSAETGFRALVYERWRRCRRDLPWRRNPTPYWVFVSEIMLQQTQADRVAPVFRRFVKKFPSFKVLAHAPLRAVLKEWQGLGYNRRALYLKQSARVVMHDFRGILPADPAVLEKLPGIGRTTAASITTFAFNKPVVFIETNIRSVFLHHFFERRSGISDGQLMPLVERVLDRKNPRRWYSALMDWGQTVKKVHRNPSRQSRHYTKQAPFRGSVRQLRGLIVSCLVQTSGLDFTSLCAKARGFSRKHVAGAIEAMIAEGLLVRRGRVFRIAA